MAPKTKILSAIGSKNFPKFVIKFLFLAIVPSNLSVIEAIINITEIFKYDYASVDYVNATNVLGTTYEKRYDLALTQDVNAAAAYKQQSITDMNNLITGVLSVNSSIDSKAIENLNAHIASLTAK